MWILTTWWPKCCGTIINAYVSVSVSVQQRRVLRTWLCTWGSWWWLCVWLFCWSYWCWCTAGRRKVSMQMWQTPPSSPLASSPWASSPPSQVCGHRAGQPAAVGYCFSTLSTPRHGVSRSSFHQCPCSRTTCGRSGPQSRVCALFALHQGSHSFVCHLHTCKWLWFRFYLNPLWSCMWEETFTHPPATVGSDLVIVALSWFPLILPQNKSAYCCALLFLHM